MLTLPLGIIATLLVLYFSFDSKNGLMYLNAHSFTIVFLGTLAVALFSIPKKDIALLFQSIKSLFRKDGGYNNIKTQLIALSSDKSSLGNTESIALIKYAQSLWEQGIDKKNFSYLMNEKFEELSRISERPVIVLKNLAKYPPALGMIGTVVGMIALFTNLSSDNKSHVGPALALAMTATFYGLTLANFMILPLADRIHVRHISIMDRNEAVLNAILKINDNEPASLIENMNIEQEYYEQAG